VYIPIETFLKIYGSNRSLTINIQARGPEWMARTQDEARALMRARRHLRPNEEDNFGILSSASIMSLWKELTGAIAASMVGVVLVFLVIGGIVIMNVMLASVIERTREIGIRKSVGARYRDILMQFLVESSLLAGFGGAIGLGLAAGIAFVVDATTSVPMAVPLSAVALAIGVSTAVGLFFGIYPAHKAAQLDPIEALRFET
jgi:putative ABC transport system permease protein